MYINRDYNKSTDSQVDNPSKRTTINRLFPYRDSKQMERNQYRPRIKVGNTTYYIEVA